MVLWKGRYCGRVAEVTGSFVRKEILDFSFLYLNI